MKIKYLLTFLLLISPSLALAQSCDIDSLGNCLFNSGQTCRSSLSGCSNENGAGLSIPDVEDAAIGSCCRFSGKNKKGRATACFRKIEAGLNVSQRTAGPIRKFIKNARRAVAELRKQGCSTGSTT